MLKRDDEIWQIYESSFPACERRKVEAYGPICEAEPAFKMDVLREGESRVGLMFHWDREAFSYLEHFAVRSDIRNRGLGGKFLDAYLSEHARVVLEVDAPKDEISRRRIGFYERHGLTFSGIHFTHPGYEAGVKPYTLYLMTRPAWTASEGEAFIDFLFRRVLKKARI